PGRIEIADQVHVIVFSNIDRHGEVVARIHAGIAIIRSLHSLWIEGAVWGGRAGPDPSPLVARVSAEGNDTLRRRGRCGIRCIARTKENGHDRYRDRYEMIGSIHTSNGRG